MDESTTFVVVRTFGTAPEAHVARSVLDADGIPTQLADDGIVALNWLYSNVVGGVKLLVPSDQLPDALAVLETPAQPDDRLSAGTGELHGALVSEASEACPHCGGTEFQQVQRGRRWAALTWLLVGVPLVPLHRARRCRQCGRT